MIREDLAFKAPLPQGISARLMGKSALMGGGNALRRRRRAREGLKLLPVFFDRSNILGSWDHFWEDRNVFKCHVNLKKSTKIL